MQTHQRVKSKERCCFVGYPGNFFKTSDVAYFRTRMSRTKAEKLTYTASGDVSLSRDGAYAVFSVKTDGTRLPAIMFEGQGMTRWESSVDAEVWMPVETDARMTDPAFYPDGEMEVIETIAPQKQEVLDNGDILVDFHELEVGSVTMRAEGNGTLVFHVGESLAEVMNEKESVRLEQYPIPAEEVDGAKDITTIERALRYMRITRTGDVKVSDIKFLAKVWPVKQLMTFESSDENLNALFTAGVKTLHTSMHNFYLDGIKRDYLPWAMDAALGTLGGDFVFGDRMVTRNGISVGLMPPHPTTDDWGIPEYPLHAIFGLQNDYLRNGDLETVKMYWDRITAQMDLYESAADEKGYLVSAGRRNGFTPGWATKNGPTKQGAATFAEIMLYYDYNVVANFARLLNENDRADRYRADAAKLKANIIADFWDDEHKAFISGYDGDGNKDMRISNHANYWAVIAGLFPEEHYDHLFTEVFPNMPYIYSDVSYDRGYEVLAYALGGHIKDYFPILDKVWGYWLREGNTRYPEGIKIEADPAEQLVFYGRPYGMSLCHAANGTPAVLTVLYGIFGFSEDRDNPGNYTLSPDLNGLDWFKGTFPVKEGLVTIEMSKDGATLIDVPKGANFRIPE